MPLCPMQKKRIAMKKTVIIALTTLLTTSAIGQSCMSLFSYGSTFETVSFINQSTVSNAHYWWNFGDGTSSHYENPIHTFPETGTYLVTLFVKDTVTNCSDFYEIWVNINKFTTNSCSTSITDSIFSTNGSDYLKIIDNSTNCGGYNYIYDAGPAYNFSSINWINLTAFQSAKFISRVRYFTSDSVNSFNIKREAYKTSVYNYSASENYGDCSANFEYSIVSNDSNGQRILFEAMNKNALSYEWEIVGFGNPIVSNNDTISQWYNYNQTDLWLIGLKTEGINGCKNTLYQQILIRPEISTLVGLDEQVKATANVQLFPNPFTHQATLTFGNPSNTSHLLTLKSLTGKVVKSYNNITTGQVIIDKGLLPSGMYFYELRTDNRQIATGKLIIE
jgi:hypothetical protein